MPWRSIPRKYIGWYHKYISFKPQWPALPNRLSHSISPDCCSTVAILASRRIVLYLIQPQLLHLTKRPQHYFYTYIDESILQMTDSNIGRIPTTVAPTKSEASHKIQRTPDLLILGRKRYFGVFGDLFLLQSSKTFSVLNIQFVNKIHSYYDANATVSFSFKVRVIPCYWIEIQPVLHVGSSTAQQ